MLVETILVVNGKEHRLALDPDRTLLEVLRDELGLTGAKYGCGEGQCGACTVLLDGAPVRSCRVAAVAANARAIRTIEGLANGERLDPLQGAFLEQRALQCGYCTPGMILTAHALLAREKAPSRAQICAAIEGNLCRCGCYDQIVRAVESAVAARKGAPR